jgi:hypothetical protein
MIQVWNSNWIVLLDHNEDPIVGHQHMDVLISAGSSFYVHDYFIKVRNEIISMKSSDPVINQTRYVPLVTSVPKVCTTVSPPIEIVDTLVTSVDRL